MNNGSNRIINDNLPASGLTNSVNQNLPNFMNNGSNRIINDNFPASGLANSVNQNFTSNLPSFVNNNSMNNGSTNFINENFVNDTFSVSGLPNFACTNQILPTSGLSNLGQTFNVSNPNMINLNNAPLNQPGANGLPSFTQSPFVYSNQPSLYHSNISSSTKTSKLDRVKLKQFYGAVEDWQAYWDIFESLVHKNPDLDLVQKFTYLSNSLHGEGKQPIKGYRITSSNYYIALEVLHKRFGKNDVVIQNHIKQLLSNSPIQCNVTSGPKFVKALWIFYDEVVAHVRSLDTLGVQGQLVSTFLCPIVLSKLPHDIRHEWFKTHDECSGNISELIHFMHDQFENLDRTVRAGNGGFSKSEISESENLKKNSLKKRTTASALHSNTKSNLPTSEKQKKKCVFCNKENHFIDTCINFLKLPIAQRCDEIRAKTICSKCLKISHNFALCKSICSTCNGKHHHLICRGPTPLNRPSIPANSNSTSGNSDTSQNVSNTTSNVNMSSQSEVLTNSTLLQHNTSNKISVLQTAKSHIITKSQSIPINILFDSGSDRTYILSDVAEKCKLKVTGWEKVVINNFGNTKSSKPQMSKVYHINLLGNDNSKYSLSALSMKEICKPLFRSKIPQDLLVKLNINKDLLSDDFTADRKIQVHLLLGLDYIWDFLNPLKCIRYESLIAQESTFGWVISGYFTGDNSYANVKTQLCCFSLSDNDLKEFLGLEVAGVTPNEKRFCDEYGPIVKKFNETLKFENNKYTVNLIWKEPYVELVNNLSIAIKRQTALEKHLVRDPELRQKYYNVFDMYESQSKIEEVPLNEINIDHRVYYLPHFPVVKDTRLSSKVRPVFDGSCKSFNDVSLNDALETGPPLQLKIFSIILRFRRWLIGLSSDVEAAFHAIKLNSVDQDVCRFILPKSDGTFKHMRFLVLPFGLNCSPYLLNAVISHHLNKYPHSNTIHELKNNTYVDDFISGCDQIETAKAIHDESNAILLDGGLKLTKWTTTDKRVQELVGCTKSEETFILGLKLNLENDTFSFSQYDFSQLSVEYTKRVLLSFIAKPYDPPGVLAPFIMAGKLIIQQLWRLGIGWDVIVPEPFINKINEWMQSTKHIHEFILPRTYFPDVGWDSITHLEIHGYSDASMNGFGAVVYLRIHTQNGYKTAFVAAKGR